MYPANQNLIDAIKSSERIVDAKVEINNVTYSADNIQSFTFEDTSNPESYFMIGSVVSAKVELSLIDINPLLNLETAEYKVYAGIEVDEKIEYIPMGVFYSEKPKRVKNVVNLTLFDGMIKTESLYVSSLTYPANIQTVMNEIATKLGVSFVGSLPNYTISIKPTGYTYREVISMIAQICGGFAKFDRSGDLTIRYYTNTSFSIDGDQYIEYEKQRDSLYQIKRVIGRVPQDDEEGEPIDYIAGPGSGIELSFENPWVTQEIVNSIYSRYSDFTYLPIRVNLQGNPLLDCGDIIQFTTVESEVINIPIMHHQLTFNGGMLSEIESIGESENQNEFSSTGPITKQLEKMSAKQGLFEILLAEKANISDLQALTITVDDLIAQGIEVGDASITTAKIADAAITNAKIKDGEINTAKIALGAITSALIEEGAIGTVQIADGSITSAKIVSLTADLINAGTLSVDRLIITGPDSIVYEINAQSSGLSITELQDPVYKELLNGTVIVAESITADQLAANSVTANKILAGAVTADKLNVSELSAISANLGNITAGHISGVVIEGGSIKSNSTIEVTTDLYVGNYIYLGNVNAPHIHKEIIFNYGTTISAEDNSMYINTGRYFLESGDRITFSLGSHGYNNYKDTYIELGDGQLELSSDYGTNLKNEIYIRSNGKYGRFGARNASYFHMQTDATNGFYSYNPLSVSSFTSRGNAVIQGNLGINGRVVAHDYIHAGAWERVPTSEGDTGTNLYARPRGDGELRVTREGTTNEYRNIRANWVVSNVLTSNDGSNVYMRPPSSGEARVTVENTTSTYRPIRASSFPTSSSILTKTNHEELTIEEALYVLNQTDVWKYHIQNNVDAGIYDKQKVGMFSETVPALIRDEDGVDTYSMVSILWRIVQEQQKRIAQLEQDRDEMYEFI